LRQFRKY